MTAWKQMCLPWPTRVKNKSHWQTHVGAHSRPDSISSYPLLRNTSTKVLNNETLQNTSVAGLFASQDKLF